MKDFLFAFCCASKLSQRCDRQKRWTKQTKSQTATWICITFYILIFLMWTTKISFNSEFSTGKLCLPNLPANISQIAVLLLWCFARYFFLLFFAIASLQWRKWTNFLEMKMQQPMSNQIIRKICWEKNSLIKVKKEKFCSEIVGHVHYLGAYGFTQWLSCWSVNKIFTHNFPWVDFTSMSHLQELQLWRWHDPKN